MKTVMVRVKLLPMSERERGKTSERICSTDEVAYRLKIYEQFILMLCKIT